MNQIQSEPVKDEAQRVTIYPIAGLAGSWEDEPFDESKLPAALNPGRVAVYPTVYLTLANSLFLSFF